MKHLGVERSPNRSTLSYANEHRPWQLYQKIFYQLLDKCQALRRGKKKFRFKNKLFSLDATIIELCASLFNWARFRQTKGAVKLHLLLDHEGYLPVFAHITDGRVHEVNMARGLSFPKGSIVVIDRGYVDYELFGRWTEEGVYFVTRLKDNADYRVVEDKAIPKDRNILKDQIIELEGYYSKEKCPHSLRRIEVLDEKNEQIIVLLTNHHESCPRENGDWRNNNNLHVQGQVADRDILQDNKAELKDKDLCRDIVQCPYDTDLDSTRSDIDTEVSEASFYLWLVFVKPCGDIKV